MHALWYSCFIKDSGTFSLTFKAQFELQLVKVVGNDTTGQVEHGPHFIFNKGFASLSIFFQGDM